MAKILALVLQVKLAGGLEIYSRDIAQSLTELGHQVSVLSALEQAHEVSGWGDLEIQFLAPSNHTLFRMYCRSWRYWLTWHLQKTKSHYDWIFVLHPHAANAVYRAGIRNYLTWTYGIEVWRDLPPPLYSGLKHSKRIISISRYTRQAVLSKLVHQTIDIIPPIVDTRKFTPRPSQAPHSDSSLKLLTVGRLSSQERYKGHESVICNLEQIQQRVGRNISYWVVGDGDDRRYLEALSQDKGVADKVKFWGRVSDDELLCLYQDCNIFVMPSKVEQKATREWSGEGFGIVYIEASACGKAVVGSDVGGAVDAIQHGVTGFCIDPKSDAELIETISRLLLDPDLAHRIGIAGRQFVEARFSKQAMLDELAQLIETL